MTTAASAAWGRSASRPLRKSSSTATIPAPTTPVSWLLAPACSATAVREALVETANPWKSPEVMLAAPMATISWLGSISSPRRAAKLDAVAMVSVRLTRVMPTAPSSKRPTSCREVHGSDGRGMPWGRTPTVATPWSERVNTAETTVAPITATSTAGSRRVKRGRTSRTTSTPTPTARACQIVWSRFSKKARTSPKKPSASTE
jgi:hypothetical protein